MQLPGILLGARPSWKDPLLKNSLQVEAMTFHLKRKIYLPERDFRVVWLISVFQLLDMLYLELFHFVVSAEKSPVPRRAFLRLTFDARRRTSHFSAATTIFSLFSKAFLGVWANFLIY